MLRHELVVQEGSREENYVDGGDRERVGGTVVGGISTKESVLHTCIAAVCLQFISAKDCNCYQLCIIAHVHPHVHH